MYMRASVNFSVQNTQYKGTVKDVTSHESSNI